MKNEPTFVVPFATMVLLARSFTLVTVMSSKAAFAWMAEFSSRCTTFVARSRRARPG